MMEMADSNPGCHGDNRNFKQRLVELKVLERLDDKQRRLQQRETELDIKQARLERCEKELKEGVKLLREGERLLAERERRFNQKVSQNETHSHSQQQHPVADTRDARLDTPEVISNEESDSDEETLGDSLMRSLRKKFPNGRASNTEGVVKTKQIDEVPSSGLDWFKARCASVEAELDQPKVRLDTKSVHPKLEAVEAHYKSIFTPLKFHDKPPRAEAACRPHEDSYDRSNPSSALPTLRRRSSKQAPG